MAAGLLVAIVGIALGWNMINPPEENIPPVAPVVNPRPMPVQPVATPVRESTAGNTAPPRTDMQPDAQVKPDQNLQAKVSDDKLSGSTSGKTSSVQKSGSRTADKCKDPDVSKRSLACLLPK